MGTAPNSEPSLLVSLRGTMSAEIRLGTSEFTAPGWLGSFYPESIEPHDFLSHYSTKFDTVEIKSTF